MPAGRGLDSHPSVTYRLRAHIKNDASDRASDRASDAAVTRLNSRRRILDINGGRNGTSSIFWPVLPPCRRGPRHGRQGRRSAFTKATTPRHAKARTNATSLGLLIWPLVAKAPANPTNAQKQAMSNQTNRDNPHTRGTAGADGLLS